MKNKHVLIFLISFLYASYTSAITLNKGTRIYKKPNPKSKVILILKKSIKVKLKGTKTQNWFYVSYKKIKGYVNLKTAGGSRSALTGRKGKSSANKSSQGSKAGVKGRAGRRGSKGSSGSSKTNQQTGRPGERPKGNARGRSSSNMVRRGKGYSKPRGMSKGQRIRAKHDAAKARALSEGKDFCSQCWYAKKGANPKRFEDTNPKIVGGELVPEGVYGGSKGKEVVE